LFIKIFFLFNQTIIEIDKHTKLIGKQILYKATHIRNIIWKYRFFIFKKYSSSTHYFFKININIMQIQFILKKYKKSVNWQQKKKKQMGRALLGLVT